MPLTFTPMAYELFIRCYHKSGDSKIRLWWLRLSWILLISARVVLDVMAKTCLWCFDILQPSALGRVSAFPQVL